MVLVNRNICELMEFNDTAEVNGRKVLGGLMGRESWQRSQYRPPTSHHEHQSVRPTGLRMSSLATCHNSQTSGQWWCWVLEDGETLVWSGEDLKCCFYLFETKTVAQMDGLCSPSSVVDL